jgi:hypothetical protein
LSPFVIQQESCRRFLSLLSFSRNLVVARCRSFCRFCHSAGILSSLVVALFVAFVIQQESCRRLLSLVVAFVIQQESCHRLLSLFLSFRKNLIVALLKMSNDKIPAE